MVCDGRDHQPDRNFRLEAYGFRAPSLEMFEFRGDLPGPFGPHTDDHELALLGTVTATAMAKIDRSLMQGPPRDPPKADPMLELVAVALARDSWLVAEPR